VLPRPSITVCWKIGALLHSATPAFFTASASGLVSVRSEGKLLGRGVVRQVSLHHLFYRAAVTISRRGRAAPHGACVYQRRRNRAVAL
jgi:hypothetical protein